MKRKSGCASWILLIVVLLAVTLGMDYVAKRIDLWRFPWGYAESGKPTLTGTWVGPMTTGSDQRLGMLVEIQLAPLDYHRRHSTIIRTRRNSWLLGRVLVCGNSPLVQHFTGSGKPDDEATASRFHLGLSPSDSVPPDGLAPSHIRGRWDGRDALALEASLYLRRGKSAISSSADPDTKGDAPVTLRRGTDADFNSLCNRLRG